MAAWSRSKYPLVYNGDVKDRRYGNVVDMFGFAEATVMERQLDSSPSWQRQVKHALFFKGPSTFQTKMPSHMHFDCGDDYLEMAKRFVEEHVAGTDVDAWLITEAEELERTTKRLHKAVAAINKAAQQAKFAHQNSSPAAYTPEENLRAEYDSLRSTLIDIYKTLMEATQ